jgi:dolichol kinase
VLGFWPSDAVLLAVQAALVWLPAPVAPRWMARLAGSAWAWLLPGSLGLTIGLIALLPNSAKAYTWLALVATPALACIALSAMLRGRWRAVALVALLLAVAWAERGSLAGQSAALIVTALSCLTLGAWLARLAPPWALEVGIVAMAMLDAILVFSHGLQHPNDLLNHAAPPAGLPRLQLAAFGSAQIGYGDLFIAAVFGGLLAAQGRERSRAASLTLACAAAFDLLFLVTDVLPATVPVALALLLNEALANREGRSEGGPAGRPDTSATGRLGWRR